MGKEAHARRANGTQGFDRSMGARGRRHHGPLGRKRSAAASSPSLVDPPVFASRDGVLDIMMVAMPQPIPTISFTPPNSSTIIHPHRIGLSDLPAAGVGTELPLGQQPSCRHMAAHASPCARRHAEDPLRQPAPES